jgi:hypothetical protein
MPFAVTKPDEDIILVKCRRPHEELRLNDTVETRITL